MAIFEYVATDQSGNSVNGTFEASDESDARNILAQYNLNPTHLAPQGSTTSEPSSPKVVPGAKDKKDSKPSHEKSIRKTFGSESRRNKAASSDSKNNTGEQMVKFQDFYTIDQVQSSQP